MAFVRTVAIVGAVLLLAGCTGTPSTDATHSSAPKPPVSATPTPSATPAAQPLPRLDLACADLADAESLELAIGTKVDPVDPIENQFSQTAAAWYNYPVLQQGGLACLWQNGSDSSDESYASAIVDVLPDAEAQYANYAKEAYLVEARCAGGYCSSDQLVDGTWLQVFLTGVPETLDGGEALPTQIQTLVDSMASVIRTAGEPAPAEPPTPAPLGTECDTILDATVVGEATGITNALSTYNAADGPQVGMSFDADGNALMTTCVVSFDNELDGQPLTASILPDAEWAMRAALAHSSPAGTGVEQAVEGVPAGDAFQRCESIKEGAITCYLDMLVDSTWVQLALTTTIDATEGTEIEADPIDALTEIASSVATKL